MTILFVILIILASIILGLVILVQNPKGGGLAGTFAGFSNQFMGVKQTTDVLEKGTWIFGGVIAILCLFSTVFIRDSVSTTPLPTAPQNNTAPASGTGFPGATPQGTPTPSADSPR